VAAAIDRSSVGGHLLTLKPLGPWGTPAKTLPQGLPRFLSEKDISMHRRVINRLWWFVRLASVLVCVSCTSVWAWDDVTLQGPTQLRRDTFDDYRVAGIQGPARVRWTIQPLSSDRATPVSRAYHVRGSADQLSIIFAAPPGFYSIQARALVKIANDPQGVGVDWLEPAIIVEVVEGNLPSPPDDDSRPRPLPTGRFNLASDTAQWVRQLVPSTHHRESAKLATSYRSQSSAIAAGTLTTTNAILASINESNGLALGGVRGPEGTWSGGTIAAWTRWSDAMERRLESLHQDGKLQTPTDYQSAWDEIATGFESIR
jgi:hypothetical protein